MRAWSRGMAPSGWNGLLKKTTGSSEATTGAEAPDEFKATYAALKGRSCTSYFHAQLNNYFASEFAAASLRVLRTTPFRGPKLAVR